MSKIDLFRKMVSISDGEIVTTSRKIAEVFGKRHSDVMRTIDRAIEKRPDLSRICTEATDNSGPNGRSLRYFLLSREMELMLKAKYTLGSKVGSLEEDYLDAIKDILPHAQIRQMNVCEGKYRVDCYIPSLSVVIEIYEKEHGASIDKDRERQKEIENWIANKKAEVEGVNPKIAKEWTGFIIIREGRFGEGLRDIFKFVIENFMSFDPLLDEQYRKDYSESDMDWYNY